MDEGASKKNDKPTNPRAIANPLSAITFWWMLKIFRMGYKRDIEVEDLFVPLAEHESQYLGDQFERQWQVEVDRCHNRKAEPSLFRVIMKIFQRQIILYGFFKGAEEIFIRLSQPMLIGLLLNYFTDGENTPKSYAFWYAGGVLLCSVINTFTMHPFMMGMFHIGLKIRVACCSLMYRKALRLSRSALEETTVGQITNLMSNDVQRFDLALIFVHYLWIGPVQSLIIMYFVYQELELAGLAGFIVVLLFMPFQGYLGKKASVYRLRTAVRTDERVRLMNEIIAGIQVIKLYTWEKPFAKMVAVARQSEVKIIRLAAYIHFIIPCCCMFITRLAIYLSLLTYVLTGETITAQKVFVVTGYYNIIKDTMTLTFPMAVTFLSEGWVSMKRVQKFLQYEELKSPSKVTDDKASDVQNGTVVKPSVPDKGISLKKVTAKWEADSEENTLTDINLNVTPGRLVAVIGPVGSGKTSLLHVILGELPLWPNSGSLRVEGRVAYSSQEPWLFAGSVRQNILFGEPFHARRYQRTIRACALSHDFQQFPHGDRTLVGERGISLSGGQKARVNLARAVYKDADIYLLDDPLSAVDSHVGKHLFEDCITGLLLEKTVLLVTHQLQYLTQADNIIILRDGKVEAQGTYSELQGTGLDFAQLLAGQENSEGDEGDKSRRRKKTTSTSSTDSLSVGYDEKGSPAIQEEEAEYRSSGRVQSNVYGRYAAACGNCCTLFLVVAMLILAPIVALGGDLWLAQWTNYEEMKSNSSSGDYTNSTSWLTTLDKETYIYVYSGLIFVTIIVTMGQSILFFNACLNASVRLHNKMFECITRATMRFFNVNPLGRILNRFSKDMGSIDESLPITMFDCFVIFLELLAICLMVAVLNFWLLLPTCAIAVVFAMLRSVFLATSRSIKRLEGVTRSPVFTHLNASLQGLTTIRAMGAQSILRNEFDNHQDLNTTAFYIFLASNRAFGLWLDIGCLVYLGCVIFSFLLLSSDSFAGNVGLAITQTMGLTGMFQWGMRQSAELENQMTAVERILEYTKVEQEPPLESDPDKKPMKEWPSQGKVEFDNVSLKYSKDDPPVLKGLSFTIMPMQKIGIVGRTGAGKSSLIAALFRLVETEGAIRIDGVDTKNLGLHDLRGKLSIIPQEPVLFSGSMRKNLDPFDEYSDSVLWQALEEVELKDAINEQPSGLNLRTSEGGSNFSVGQRQLVCLARAIIRNNKILVLDEATANVDPQTDALIQKTIRRKFAACTVLTIAHRLHTVMDNDKLLVMDGGKVAEFDHPYRLLQNPSSFLRSLVEQTGKAMTDELCSVAKENYDKSQHEKAS